MMAGSVYVRSTSTLSSPSTRKEKKKKRRHTNKDDSLRDSGIETRPSSQWYLTSSSSPTNTPMASRAVSLFDDSTTVTSPLIELRQQLTPTRPLRSEMEKERRLSRPPSLFSSRMSTASTPNGNRDSVGGSSSLVSGTTDSTNKLRISRYLHCPRTLSILLRHQRRGRFRKHLLLNARDLAFELGVLIHSFLRAQIHRLPPGTWCSVVTTKRCQTSWIKIQIGV
ncbi:hypothetical protein GE061_014988 [Apolygus lucorum]|uniref:Uncharacterized protein n=1 Tax=Apolygus lucorum TaxID=248454 RepID=A0A8S9XJS8_APOLU|nr:hypothetical protein GE061_014988 [Apolygus lucorum]